MNKLTVIALALLSCLGLQRCISPECSESKTVVEFVPHYMSWSDFRNAVAFEAPQEISHTGRIHVLGNFLLISEPYHGIHVINNSDPANPINTGFMRVPGNTELTTHGNYVYANSDRDLVTLDFSDPNNPAEIGRCEDVLVRNNPNAMVWSDPDQAVAYWEFVERDVVETCNDIEFNNPNMFFADQVTTTVTITSGAGGRNGSTVSKAGSTAQLVAANDHLFILKHLNNFSTSVEAFDLQASATCPPSVAEIWPWNQPETLFPVGDNLFIGGRTGVTIADISTPSSTSIIGSFQHGTACDPVVVQNDLAYVTLRSGTPCNGFTNQLDVLDVSTVTNPILLSSHNMHNPSGLAIDGDILAICDGSEGLKVYNASNQSEIGQSLLDVYTGITPSDVIIVNGVAIVVGTDGVHQLDISDPSDIKLLSTL